MLGVRPVINDVADDPFSVYDEGHTAVGEALLVEDAKGLGRGKGRKVGHHGEGHAAVVSEGLLRCGGIGAGTQYLGF